MNSENRVPAKLIRRCAGLGPMHENGSCGETKPAVFEFFVRRLPDQRGFLIAAGLEQAFDFLEGLHFSEDELDWLASSGRFTTRLIDYLRDLRFSGDVHAMPEGTAFFADEPILRVTAPLPEAQLTPRPNGRQRLS